MLIFDTSILIELERKTILVDFIKQLRELHSEQPAITFATYAEYMYGVRKAKRDIEQTKSKLETAYRVLHSTNKVMDQFSSLKYTLEKAGKNVADFDLLIAATVLANKGILVTADRHFERIERLQLILI